MICSPFRYFGQSNPEIHRIGLSKFGRMDINPEMVMSDGDTDLDDKEQGQVNIFWGFASIASIRFPGNLIDDKRSTPHHRTRVFSAAFHLKGQFPGTIKR
jgi:hypothetical protein